jgi:hypothetical protein
MKMTETEAVKWLAIHPASPLAEGVRLKLRDNQYRQISISIESSAK